jgi:Fur family zinc uptake transcriptional regulator
VNARTRQTGNEILHDAETYCRDEGLRLTEGRRVVLELLVLSPAALKAYDILEQLKRPGEKPMPPTVYRALDFWIEHGFVHRIESINAYFACGHPLHNHGCQLLVCQQCNTALEVCSHGLHGHFTETARDNGYLFRKAVLEIHGVCPNCQERARTAE